MKEIIVQYQTHKKIIKQKQPNRNELPTSENRNATQPNNPEQTLTQ